MLIRYLMIASVLLVTTVGLSAHGISDADKQAMLTGGYLQYMDLGVTHMLTGYDHLLFLFGVIFFLTSFSDVLKFVTVFTLGHCITLVGATYAGITVNYFLIDAVIALTVIYKGFDNVDGFRRFFDTKSPNLLVLVFIFGLIHGFGLSTRLQELPLGEDGLLLRILSFNLGVEVGQILALAAMVVALSVWRHTPSFKRFSVAVNVGLMVAGALLFLVQTHGLVHLAQADELAFSHDGHAHAHTTLDAAPITVPTDAADVDASTVPPVLSPSELQLMREAASGHSHEKAHPHPH